MLQSGRLIDLCICFYTSQLKEAAISPSSGGHQNWELPCEGTKDGETTEVASYDAFGVSPQTAQFVLNKIKMIKSIFCY